VTTRDTYDIVVIGSGLAGLSVAMTAAQGCDAAIALIEGRAVGSNNPTPMTFADVLEQFDLTSCITARYRRFTFHSPLGGRSSHTFDSFPLVAFDYRRACVELLNRSRAVGDVTFINSQATRLVRDATGRWHIGTRDGEQVSASLLVDASGRRLFTARALGLPYPRMFSHCFGQVLEGGTVPDREEAFFLTPSRLFGGGGGWLYPLADGRVSFGYATLSQTAIFPGHAVKTSYYRALQEFQPYSEWLANARPISTEIGTIPIFPLQRFVYPGLMQVGDAAGQATIWACMGTAAALVGGQLAGRVVAQAHREQKYSVAILKAYQRQWDQKYRRVYRQAAWLAPLIWHLEDINWNQQLQQLQQLTPEQMLARLRINWPLLPWWKILLIRAYGLAGRARRGLARGLFQGPVVHAEQSRG